MSAPERGGVLLETVLALALTAMLAVAAAAATRFAADALDRAAARAAAAAQAHAADRRLRATLRLIGPEAGLVGDAAAMAWRGVGPDGAAGLWRLSAQGGALTLARCAAGAPPSPRDCAEAADFGPADPAGLRYAGADGEEIRDWRAADPPVRIVVIRAATRLAVAPMAAARGGP